MFIKKIIKKVEIKIKIKSISDSKTLLKHHKFLKTHTKNKVYFSLVVRPLGGGGYILETTIFF